jgi:pyrroloquinoline quinone biosynthesis protein D
VLLFPEGVVHLSPTAEAILKRCDGQSTTGAIVTSLAKEYEAEEQDLRADVIECLSELHQRKLIVLA